MRPKREFMLEVEPHLRKCLARYLQRYDGYVDATGMKAHYAGLGGRAARWLYRWVRQHRPSTIVETGVCNGVSSFALLMALEKNGHGRLWSVDKPHYVDEPFDGPMAKASRRQQRDGGPINSMVPRDWGVGWIVPDDLRHRWTLVAGDAREELGPVVDRLEHIDLFIHDSLHTEEHVLWECRRVWPQISEGGLCVIDNAGQNDADHILEEEFDRYRMTIHGYRTVGFVK